MNNKHAAGQNYTPPVVAGYLLWGPQTHKVSVGCGQPRVLCLLLMWEQTLSDIFLVLSVCLVDVLSLHLLNSEPLVPAGLTAMCSEETGYTCEKKAK